MTSRLARLALSATLASLVLTAPLLAQPRPERAVSRPGTPTRVVSLSPFERLVALVLKNTPVSSDPFSGNSGAHPAPPHTSSAAGPRCPPVTNDPFCKG